MSNFDGKDKLNIKWISQVIYSEGIQGLENWLESVDQDMKDDTVRLIEQLASHLKKGVCSDCIESEGTSDHGSIDEYLKMRGFIDEVLMIERIGETKKPALYLVKSEKSENNCK